MQQPEPEGLVTCTQRASPVQVKDGHLEASQIECLDSAYRIQLGPADFERIDAMADADGTHGPQRVRGDTRRALHALAGIRGRSLRHSPFNPEAARDHRQLPPGTCAAPADPYPER